MIKFNWICFDCGTIQECEEDNDEPFSISDLIRLECSNCKSKFEFSMNRQ